MYRRYVSALLRNHVVGRGGASGLSPSAAVILHAFPDRIRWGESAYPARQG
jgi:hypothetical protein